MASALKNFLRLLADAGNSFLDDNATKLSASLAYFAIFAASPLLLLVITLLGFFYKKPYVTNEVFDQLGNIIGKQGAVELQAVLQNISSQNHSSLFGIVGVVVLVFTATGVFTEIQSSINYIWCIRVKPKRSWLKYVTDRLISFLLIVGLGLLTLISLLVNVVINMVSEYLQRYLGSADVVLLRGANQLLLFAVVTVLFSVIYKVLPDAYIYWMDAAKGGIFTAILFLIGKYLIGYYLGISGAGNAFGAATSIILILTWVYYSALILYFGAEFTKAYAMKWGKGITVKEGAVFIIKHEATPLEGTKRQGKKKGG